MRNATDLYIETVKMKQKLLSLFKGKTWACQ